MKTFLISQQCNYPKPLYYALMNLLSSHDIPRIRTTLATGMNENLPSREQQAEYVITSKMDQKGKALTRLLCSRNAMHLLWRRIWNAWTDGPI